MVSLYVPPASNGALSPGIAAGHRHDLGTPVKSIHEYPCLCTTKHRISLISAHTMVLIETYRPMCHSATHVSGLYVTALWPHPVTCALSS